jgi:HD-GYP domain-containing protein (c-di-GMP phosphodiesterase class II)
MKDMTEKVFFGKKGDDIPLMSQMIFFANMLDEMFDLSHITLETKKNIENFVQSNTSKLFSSKISNAFMELTSYFEFWGSLEFFHIVSNPTKFLKDYEVEITLDQFHDMVQIYSNIVDSKSKFTAKHSQEIVEKTSKLIDQLGFDENHKKMIVIAANLHDLGKLATPIEILEKEGPLNDDELFEIKKHAFFTFTILDGIDFCDDILKWASYHHEKPDGSGYPFGISKDNLSLEARFIACLDMYQALTEDRPYRPAMSHEKAINIMKESLTEYYVDFFITGLIDETFGEES